MYLRQTNASFSYAYWSWADSMEFFRFHIVNALVLLDPSHFCDGNRVNANKWLHTVNFTTKKEILHNTDGLKK